MRTKKIVWTMVIVLVMAAIVASACGGGAEEPDGEAMDIDGETLLQERCTECHGLDRVTSVEQTRAEWEETVTDMIERGARLNEEEKTVLVDYLAETYGP
jgi:hypothetical protein